MMPTENTQIAVAAMAPSPAASPSSPSTKFIALTIVSVNTTVSSPAWSWSRTRMLPSPKGMYSSVHDTPIATRTPAAAAWPASLVTAPSPRMSSTIPTSTITPPATMVASTSGAKGGKARFRAGSCAAR